MVRYYKRALLLGCNYPNTPFTLERCVQDMENVRAFITTERGFPSSHVRKLYNQAMNYNNIWNHLHELVKLSHSYAKRKYVPAFVIAYSGHGTSLPTYDPKGLSDEYDQEALVPYDVQKRGVILDDDLYANFITKLHPSTQLFILVDACNSGTVFDLPYADGRIAMRNHQVKCSVIQLAGAKDDQLSVETSQGGLLTTKFLQVMRKRKPKLISSLKRLVGDLSIPSNKQEPVLAVSDLTKLNNRLFAWLARKR